MQDVCIAKYDFFNTQIMYGKHNIKLCSQSKIFKIIYEF